MRGRRPAAQRSAPVRRAAVLGGDLCSRCWEVWVAPPGSATVSGRSRTGGSQRGQGDPQCPVGATTRRDSRPPSLGLRLGHPDDWSADDPIK